MAIGITTVYLFAYAIIAQVFSNLPLALTLFAFSPFLLIWMVYSVLKYGNYKGKELKENEEWGYEDKNRKELTNLS